MGHTGTGPQGSSNNEWCGGGDAGWRVEMLAKDEQVRFLTARLAAAEAHEQQTHERLGAILGTDTSLEEAAKRMAARLAAAEAAAQWCWVRLGDADYDLACVKWPWLNASSVVLHKRAAKAGGLE